jgi:glycosyltransferase involved in cell wall biosynthesis
MGNKNPLVSIVVPSYNHEKYITEAIESVFNSAYKNIEVIVIDDGSTDNSANIIIELSKKYKFNLIIRENRGLTKTLNQALNIAKGKYFFHIGSDDKILPNKISLQVDCMEQNPDFGLCYGKMVELHESTGELREQKVRKIRSGWIFDELLKHDFIPLITHFAKRDVLLELGGYDENLWLEDWDMWLRIAEKYQIGYINEFLGIWRLHENNNSKKILKMINAEKYTLEKWKNHKTYNSARTYREIYWFNILAKDFKKEALKYIWTAIKNPLRSRSIKGFGRFLS